MNVRKSSWKCRRRAVSSGREAVSPDRTLSNQCQGSVLGRILVFATKAAGTWSQRTAMSRSISTVQCPTSDVKLSLKYTASTIVLQEQHATRDCQGPKQLGEGEEYLRSRVIRMPINQHASHPQGYLPIFVISSKRE